VVYVESNILSFTVAPVSLKVDEVKPLEVEIFDRNNVPLDASKVTWSWLDPSQTVAELQTPQASVKGKSKGTAKIVATYTYPSSTGDNCEEERKAEADITVDCRQIDFTLNAQSQETIQVDDQRYFWVDIVDTADPTWSPDASAVTWTLGGPNRNAVELPPDRTGPSTTITAKEPGLVYITATYNDGCQAIPKTVQITVDCRQIDFTLNAQSQETIQVGDGILLKAKVVDKQTAEELDVSGVSWTLDGLNPSAVDLSEITGPSTTITANEPGQAEITATYYDGCQPIPLQETVQINVECPQVTLQVNPPQGPLALGDDFLLWADVFYTADPPRPLDVSGVTWGLFGGDIDVVELSEFTGPSTTITAMKPGSVDITATYDDGCQTSPLQEPVQIEVAEPIVSFLLPYPYEIYVGDPPVTLQVEVKNHRDESIVCPSEIEWIFPEIISLAPVSATAVRVTGVETGLAEIVASCEGGSAQADITVLGPLDVAIDPAAKTINLDDPPLLLTVWVMDDSGDPIPGGCPSDIQWIIPPEDIILFDRTTHTVTGVSPGGPVIITAICEGQPASSYITVESGSGSEPPESTTVEIDTDYGSGQVCMQVDDTLQLKATVYDANSDIITNYPLEWYDLYPEIADIDETTGVVTAVSDGWGGIEACTEDFCAWVTVGVSSLGVSPLGFDYVIHSGNVEAPIERPSWVARYGQFPRPDIPGAQDVDKVDFNESGVLVGNYRIMAPAGELGGWKWSEQAVARGFMDDGEHLTTIHSPLAQDPLDSTTVTAINDNGVVVGGYGKHFETLPPCPGDPYGRSGTGYGFLYYDGTYQTIDTIPPYESQYIRDINNSGQMIVRASRCEGTVDFLYDNGTWSPISVPWADWTSAVSINNSGQITGYCELPSTGLNRHGFVYDGGLYFTFAIPGANSTRPKRIYDSGQIDVLAVGPPPEGGGLAPRWDVILTPCPFDPDLF
jgi:uncharacterized protein YjdB